MFELTGFQRDMLFVINALDESHGLGIKEELENLYESEVNHGRLYPNLDQLIEMGFVEKGEIDKRTNSYSITRRGREEIQNRFQWQADRSPNLFEEVDPSEDAPMTTTDVTPVSEQTSGEGESDGESDSQEETIEEDPDTDAVEAAD